MNNHKSIPLKTKSIPTKTSSRSRILRAVASSTAIETGQAIKAIEATLKSNKSKYNKLSLAT